MSKSDWPGRIVFVILAAAFVGVVYFAIADDIQIEQCALQGGTESAASETPEQLDFDFSEESNE